ncbi:acylglycerol kinase family protein [Pelagibius sp.]|uniref:acylglycerol kinase family protein n=1 Tax=Pelagibius sp. TaxID=1931238 RepID=UPI00262FC786|nr:acylglycerol kinase family protein [Pelagibius sp.]
MARLGVITNPRSQKNKGGLDRFAKVLAEAPETRHVVLGAITEIPEILADFARQEIDVVAVAGGDGTVQAVLTELFGTRPYEKPPRLAVVPRGMTNMIAADVGLRRRGLTRLLQTRDAGELDRATVERRILRLENARDRKPQYGMFFGGAAIYRAILACRNQVHPYQIKADAAAAVTLAGLLGGWLLRGGRRSAEAEAKNGAAVFSGDRIEAAFDNLPPQDLFSLVVLATTLDRLILGSRPFWNGSQGHLRFTSIAYPPERILRYAWRLLYGREDRSLPDSSYMSRKAGRVSLTMNCPFTLDGELLEPEAEKPVILTAADQARFLRI